MKKLFVYIFLTTMIMTVTSCKKFFDINKNPNRPTEGISEEVIMPKTIVEWANFIPQASAYGEEVVGYTVNPGGVSGWGTLVSYVFGPGNWTNMWTVPYDNLTDIKVVIDKAASDQEYINYGAAAKILKAIHYQHLVDTYNNVPYSQANLGLADITPAYDNGPDIYKSIASLLDSAINDINGAADNSLVRKLSSATDPLFGGNMTKWKQLANTVKLRIIIRGGDKVAFANRTFTSDGFLTEDAVVQPGYTKVAGKLNPVYSRTYDVAGAQVPGLWQQRVPSYFVLGFYDGNKISDKYRGNLVYRSYPSPGVNMLGRDPQDESAAKVKSPNDWYVAIGSPSATNYAGIGIIKGPSAAQPIMLATESFFLQAEGALRGIIAGDVKALFNRGILESFKYLNKNEAGTTSNLYVNRNNGKLISSVGVTDTIAINPQAEFNEYLLEGLNSSNRLVDFNLATTFEQKLEAIITQKYIAMNNLFGHEAWNEYRRTKYPVSATNPTYPSKRYTSFISLQSAAPDKGLPARIQYPQNEFTYNSENVEAQKGSGDKGLISVFLDKIFWAQ